MNSQAQRLEVLLYGQPIGTLTGLPGDKTLFAFNPDYIDTPERPTLSLSFKDKLGDLITEIKPTQTRIPPFFSNLLPEGHLRTYLAKKARVKEMRELPLLRVLGEDLPGAITVRPADGQEWYASDENGAGDQSDQDPKRYAEVLRFSLAGVQLKFSAISESTGGLTIPAKGIGGSWILKLPSTRFPNVPENEFSMMSLARMVGIDVPDVELVSLDSIRGLPDGIERFTEQALSVRRFDRTVDQGLIHIEDFAQIFNLYPEEKYGKASYRNVADVIWAETGEAGISEMVKRLIFNALIGNADMHLKNWSVIYRDRRRATLSPGYDFVSTIAYLPDQEMALKLGKSKKMSELTMGNLRYFAAKSYLPEGLVLEVAREVTDGFREIWRQEKNNLPLTKHMIDKIDAHLPMIPLFLEEK